MRKIFLSMAVAAVLCGNAGSCGIASAPPPITNLKQATDATNLAEKGALVAIQTAKPSPATATMMNNIRGDARAALDQLYADEQQGKSLVFSTLDTALAALNAAAPSASSAASSAAS